MSDIQEKVGKKVREIRKQKGLSQEELAFRSGLHRTYISDIERGDRNVSVKNIDRIARALGVKPSELLEN